MAAVINVRSLVSGRKCAMLEMLTRGIENLVSRGSGPLHFRLFVQPLMATILAIRAGWGDAWEGQPIFFWTLVREPKRTAAMRPPCPLISGTLAQKESTGHGGSGGKKCQKMNGIAVRALPKQRCSCSSNIHKT